MTGTTLQNSTLTWHRLSKILLVVRHPFCNYLFRGQPGGGKSTFVQIIAAGLGLPYYSDVLRDDLSGDFFSGYYAPDVDNKGKNQYKSLEELLAEMPTPEDMAFDPVTAYETITGKVNDMATAKDCMEAMTRRIVRVYQESERGEQERLDVCRRLDS